MTKRFCCAVLFIVALFAFLTFPARSGAQAALRRLTTTRDVMEFVWAPGGDDLYVTREGTRVTLDASRQQIAGNLFRVHAGDGSSTPVAENANSARAAIAGDAVAFTRLNADGSARVLEYDPASQETRDVGGITFGAVPQWERAGGTLLFVQEGKLRRVARNERTILFQSQTFPTNARVSPLGDRIAWLDAEGLWVARGTGKQNLSRPTDGVIFGAQFVWSNAGDKLAFSLTRDGFDPEVWVADTSRGTTTKIMIGRGLEFVSNLAWSPDDAFVIFTRTPAGSSGANRSEIWRARTDGSDVRALTHNNVEESLPQYAPDGKSLAFLRDGDVWVMDLNGEGLPQADADGLQNQMPDFETPRVTGAQRTPPATIRVRHDAANACRSVPLGQIDTIDFETYVKRVVPSEVYPSWDDDALKAQAVAARTYAWFWVLQHTLNDYDVTDTTAYQYMCDVRYASTDNATDATRGQYLDYQGYMVFAAFGAENGDPTLTNTFSNPYLLGVDDPVGFMKTRAGNGIGMSQWGAQRWANQYSWNYQQILRHYYSNITLQAPAGSLMDAVAPIGAVIAPWSNWGVTSSRVHIIVNASDDSSGIASVDLRAHYLFNGVHDEVIATLDGAEREYTWDVSLLPNQTNVVVTPILRDARSNTSTGASVTFDLDRKLPQGTLTGPATTQDQTVTLNLSASDGGGSGLTSMMFSNNWEWQGENQSVEPNSGSVVADAAALNGSALRGLAGTNPAGAWYGPYTNVLPLNQPYRAYFRIKTDNVNTPEEIALLDVVVDGGSEILGLKRVHGTELKSANTYQEFYVDFYYAGFATNALEFRVAYRATASLWLDRILVVAYPVLYANTAEWTLTNGHGNKRVLARFADGAGNVSRDAVATIFFGQNPPTPRIWLPFIIRQK